MMQASQEAMRKISLRLKQYPDDPKHCLVHMAYVNKRDADTYEQETQKKLKRCIPQWALEDFGLKLACAKDLETLRNCISAKYTKAFRQSEEELKGAAWERYWIQLHINKELRPEGK